MSFLYPAFLVGALAIALPIVLHFLRRDAVPEVSFSAVRLLQQTPIERSRRRRLRDILLLVARVTALVLLAAAFARPFVRGAAASPVSPVRVIAIDRSLSMSAPRRLDRALAVARRAIDEAGLGERVAVIAFDERADVISPPGSAGDARAALGGVRAGYAATRYGPMMVRAMEVIDSAAARLIVVSDLQPGGWDDEPRTALPSSVQLSVLDVGATVPNLGVTALRVERDRVVATIRNAGEARPTRLVVSREGREVASATTTAGADAAMDVPIAYRAPASGSLSVSVDDETGLTGDNTRYAVLDPAARTRVLVITAAGGTVRSGFYVSRAIETSSDGAGDEPIEMRALTASQLSPAIDGELARVTAVVLLSTRGLDRAARESLAGFVDKGGGLLIAAGSDVEPTVVSTMFQWQPDVHIGPAFFDQESGAAGSPVTLSATDLRHPIFRPFGTLAANLGQVRFAQAWNVQPDGWEIAARFTNGVPALLERKQGAGRIVLFASDLDRRWNDFPLHPGFVPFTIEAVRYVAGAQDQARDYLVGHAPVDADVRPGIYRARPGGRAVAVNVDPRESDGASLRPDEFQAMIDRVAAAPGPGAEVRDRQIEARQNYWQYGLLLMLGALIVESVLGRA